MGCREVVCGHQCGSRFGLLRMIARSRPMREAESTGCQRRRVGSTDRAADESGSAGPEADSASKDGSFQSSKCIETASPRGSDSLDRLA